jgi:transcriptional regulator with XRE-family HTH domain
MSKMDRRDWTKVEPRSELGRRLRKARLRARLSQEELAQAAGLTLQTVQRVETQGAPPARRTTAALVKVLEVTEEWLLHGVGESPTHVVPPAVEEYLTSLLGSDTPPEVAVKLRELDFETVGGDEGVSVRAVHLMRETIERMLTLKRQPRHGGTSR